jgi:hypothetical protein
MSFFWPARGVIVSVRVEPVPVKTSPEAVRLPTYELDCGPAATSASRLKAWIIREAAGVSASDSVILREEFSPEAMATEAGAEIIGAVLPGVAKTPYLVNQAREIA